MGKEWILQGSNQRGMNPMRKKKERIIAIIKGQLIFFFFRIQTFIVLVFFSSSQLLLHSPIVVLVRFQFWLSSEFLGINFHVICCIHIS